MNFIKYLILNSIYFIIFSIIWLGTALHAKYVGEVTTGNIMIEILIVLHLINLVLEWRYWKKLKDND